MRKMTIAAVLVFVPMIAQAQTGVQAQSQASVSAQARAPRPETRLSAESQSKVDANIRAAREHKLPEKPIRDRVAEGQAKGASEAEIVAASGRMFVDLQTSYDAMVRGGHAQPSAEEVTRGSQLLARGYTSANIEAVAHNAPSDRSLVVAFETLTSLQARGVPTARAVAQVENRLSARASDLDLRGLAVNANATAGVTSAASGAANGTGARVTGQVAGTVSGALGKP